MKCSLIAFPTERGDWGVFNPSIRQSLVRKRTKKFLSLHDNVTDICSYNMMMMRISLGSNDTAGLFDKTQPLIGGLSFIPSSNSSRLSIVRFCQVGSRTKLDNCLNILRN